ncbi:LruC domain-containing protein [Owenweeksia hongkongensis]|uniref:LruC domain-containing protein n=1 Tax=Owenweeksia hongkongensis TaxID=253245 RepID=UPI003A8EC76F
MNKALSILAIASLFLASCNKNEDSKVNQNPSNATNLGSLTIPTTFNWSNSLKGNLNVTINTSNNFLTEGQRVQVIDELNNVLETTTIKGNKCSFYLNLPQTEGSYYLHSPSTGDKRQITGTGNVSFKLHTDPKIDIEGMLANATPANQRKSSSKKRTAANLLVNGDFSQNSFSSSSDVGIWYQYNNDYTWSTENGSKVWKVKNKKDSYIQQVVNVPSGDSLIVTTDHYSSAGNQAAVLIIFYDSNSNLLQYSATYLSSGFNNSSIAKAIPTNTATATVLLYGYNKTWFDNVTAETKSAVIDADNDGVEDSQDEFPNDPNKAFTGSYPTAGTQKLAFEDSWPNQGDFDFNDMVIDSKVDYTLNANNELVDATFNITLQAAGAGLNNGLAINLVDATSKSAIQNSIISSITGATLDPNNINGIIVFDDAFQAQSTYYTNTGTGADATPDVFTFTITFTSGTSTNLIPDFYIFRTQERGREIHLDGFSGSAAADVQLYGTQDDVNGTYKTESGLPWALEVTSYDTFQHPLEKVDILVAYPQFQSWAESGGTLNLDWFLSPSLPNIF